jgi:hypothetical protein
VNQVSLVVGSTQNIQQPKASEAKNTLVTSIMAVKTIAFAVVHARGGQMTDPPHRQKECQQQTIQTSFVLDQTRCQGRCTHEPIWNWPPWLNELQRTKSMSADEQTPTKLRRDQVIPTPTSKRRLPNASG